MFTSRSVFCETVYSIMLIVKEHVHVVSDQCNSVQYYVTHYKTEHPQMLTI